MIQHSDDNFNIPIEENDVIDINGDFYYKDGALKSKVTEYEQKQKEVELSNSAPEEEDLLFDHLTLKKVFDILKEINQKTLTEFRILLVSKENEKLVYFESNYYIRDAFFKIYNYLSENTHLKDQFSCFFTFKELLKTLSTMQKYQQVLGFSQEQFLEDANKFDEACKKIIAEQMKNKKTLKNRKINQKRKIKELEKQKAVGLITKEQTEKHQLEALGLSVKKEEKYNSYGLLKKQVENPQQKQNYSFSSDEDNDINMI